MIQKPEFEDKKTINNCYGDDRPNQCKEGNNQPGSTPVWNNGFGTGSVYYYTNPNAINEDMAKRMIGPEPICTPGNPWYSTPINNTMSSAYGNDRPDQCREGDSNQFGSTPTQNNGFGTGTYFTNPTAQSPMMEPHYSNINSRKTDTKQAFKLDLTSSLTYKHFTSPLYDIKIPDVILRSYITSRNICKLNSVRIEVFNAVRRYKERYNNNIFIYGTDDPDLELIGEIIDQVCKAFKIDRYEFRNYILDPITAGFAMWVLLGDIIKTLEIIQGSFGLHNIPNICDEFDIEQTGVPIIPRVDIDKILENNNKTDINDDGDK